MGAIAIFLGGEGRPTADIVGAMSAAAPHRGPHVRTLVHGDCALSCSNPDDRTDADIATSDGVAAAFTGTLDNARELEADLARLNRRPAAQGVAALVAEAFLEYGEELPAHLRGVFAGAVATGSHVYCFRDQLGYAPLFYRSDAQGFFAASEAKQVVVGAGIRKEPDLEVVERILFGDIDDELPSALRGVRRLPKATIAAADHESVRLRRYWWPEPLLETANLSDDEIHERFIELMDQAVARCLTGRDAISLSGGVDSPAVAAFAAPRHLEISGNPLQALSVVYPQFPSVDERHYIELVATSLGIPVHLYEQRANVLDGLAEWVALTDGPFLTASLAHYAEDYRLARELGFQTLLTGEHAEHTFNMQAFVLGHYLTHGRFRQALHELSEHRRRGTPVWWLPVLVGRAVAPPFAVAAKRRRASIGVPSWVDLRKANEAAAASFGPAKERWRTLQLSALIGPGLSVEAEETCQAVCGVRARRPWTDVDLFEFFLSLPAEVKFPDRVDKSLVRRLLAGRVPDEILDRRDRTVFDDALMGDIDYARLRAFLVNPAHRMPGIDYEQLSRCLHDGAFESVREYGWARNLAAVHAFLSQW